MASELTKTVTAGCFCKSVCFTITVLVSALPLSTHLCSCSICRYVHGTLACFHAPLPTGIAPRFSTDTSSLTRYRHADAASDRLFCSTCGCHIGDEDIVPNHASGALEWRIVTSIFEAETHRDESIFKITTHVYPEPEPIIGLHTWLPRIGDRKLSTWKPAPDDPNFPIPRPMTPEKEVGIDGHERLRGECHCGGVSFTFPRPNHPSMKGSDVVKSYTSPVDDTKWVASLDVCDDCRLATGAQVIPWTFVPLAILEPPVQEDLKFGTLKTYKTSEPVLRAFCGRCGATVFFLNDKKRVEGRLWTVDIAVGILRAPEGPAAENWLTWRTGRMSYYKSGLAYDPTFTKALAEGIRAWGEREHGEVLSFEVPRKLTVD